MLCRGTSDWCLENIDYLIKKKFTSFAFGYIVL